MKKIGYRITVRDGNNKLLATMSYDANERKQVVSDMKTLPRKFNTDVCLRGSRITKLFSDVQWYSLQILGRVYFSRRLVSTNKNETWQLIRSVLHLL